MPVEEGRFGVRFRPGSQFDGGPSLKLPAAVLALVAAVSFLTVRGIGCVRAKFASDGPAREEAPSIAKDARSSQTQPAAQASEPQTEAKESPPKAKAAQKAPHEPTKEQRELSARWLSTAPLRSARVRPLLERLAAAERSGDEALIVSTIEGIRLNPALADLEDPLSRRLGDLHVKRLLGGEDTLLVTTVSARRGDTLERMARERGTTLAALEMLNPALKGGKHLEPGAKVRTLNFPRCLLVVRSKIGFSDLFVNGKFFRRYYGSVKPDSHKGPCTLTKEMEAKETMKALGAEFSPPDMAEISAFLAPGSQIIISTP